MVRKLLQDKNTYSCHRKQKVKIESRSLKWKVNIKYRFTKWKFTTENFFSKVKIKYYNRKSPFGKVNSYFSLSTLTTPFPLPPLSFLSEDLVASSSRLRCHFKLASLTSHIHTRISSSFSHGNYFPGQSFSKPTETFQYAHFTSCHPLGVKKGFVKGEAKRLLFKKKMKSTFLILNFAPKTLKQVMENWNLIQNQHLLSTNF